VDGHCRAWWAQGCKKDAKGHIWGHIGSLMGGYWGPLAACWSLLGGVFCQCIPRHVFGGIFGTKIGPFGDG